MNQVNIHAGLLYAQLKNIFPYDFIQTNVRKEHKIKFPASDSYMEFDFYIEKYGLCFEFQDTYHYVNTWYNHDTQTHIRWKDILKNSTVRQNGMTFVDVSCWWDGSIEQLVATIKFKRPDVLPTLPDYIPIPFNPRFGYLQVNELPGLGELMLASFPDSNFSASIGPNTWWMGEKFDGIRCYWNPSNKTGYTRYMNELSLVPQFMDCLPTFSIDSEIWFGRGQFGAVYGLLRDSFDVSWFSLRSIAFDLPLARNFVYEDRYQFLLSHINIENPVCIVVPRVLCAGSSHLNSTVQNIIDGGGEGVILQHVNSLYQNGRSPHLFKIKAAPGDAEAIVILIEEDKSVKLQQPQGTTFTVPSGDVHIPLQVGDVVSYSFEGHARRETPVNPKIFRIRTDVLWDDIVNNARSAQHYSNEFPQDTVNYTNEAHGHWTASKGKNIRTFLENFAKKRNLDPTDPNTWYTLTRKEIEKAKGGATVVNYFKGGFVKSIMKLFPDIGLVENKFSEFTNISFHWLDVSKRRAWLEEYAKNKGFEPLIPKNWYNITLETIDDPETRAILQHYSGNMVRALRHIFPEFELDPKQFIPIHRKYFERFTTKRGLNPKLAKTWYSLDVPTLFAWKRGKRILSLYNYDLYETLRHLFPEIRLDPAKCPPTKRYWQAEMNRIKKKRSKQKPDDEKRGYWFLKSNRRQFFLKFAEEHTFDPYILSNWYSTTKEALRNTTGSRNIMYFYDSFAKALLELFPNLPWEKSKLKHLSSDELDEEERRQLLLQFAEDYKIDPNNPDHWYSINKSDFVAFPGARKVLSCYNNSLARTLVSLLPSLKLDPSQFRFLRNYWNDPGKRAHFFETFAKDNSFDPYVPENWYPIRPEKILVVPGGKKLLSLYGNSLCKALLDAFPDMNLQRSKFQYIGNYWELLPNQRKFFEGVAKNHNFDPLISKNWYTFPTSSFMAAKGAGMILSKHKSFSQALVDLFPEVEFDLSKFQRKDSQEKSTLGTNLDETHTERRRFFEQFAKERNFDPLVPTNWYQVSNEEFMRARGVHSVLAHYSGIVRALIDIFPDIGLDESKFTHYPNRHWLEIGNRRKVFENFAKENKFNPLVPDNWYKVPKETLLATKGVVSILSYYNSSLPQALLDLFPSIGLDESKFAVIPKHYWKDKENRRKYLEGFAKSHGFDPRVPENWYPLPKENLIYSMQNGKIVNIKGSKQILEYHGSMGKALADLFPEAGFDPSKFAYL